MSWFRSPAGVNAAAVPKAAPCAALMRPHGAGMLLVDRSSSGPTGAHGLSRGDRVPLLVGLVLRVERMVGEGGLLRRFHELPWARGHPSPRGEPRLLCDDPPVDLLLRHA